MTFGLILLKFEVPRHQGIVSAFNVQFYIDYFNCRDVKHVCLITCDDSIVLNHKLAKRAVSHSMSVSLINFNDDFNDKIVFNKCLLQKSVSTGVFVDGQCQKMENILYFASQNMYFDSMHKWLIEHKEGNWKSNDTSIDMNSIIRNLNISVDADIILASENENSFVLTDVFNFGKIQGGSLVFNEVGYWIPVSGLHLEVDLNGYKYYRRWNFLQWTMRMVIVVSGENFDPKKLLDLNPVPGVTVITQTSSVLLYVLAEIHNFNFIHTITDRWISTFDRNSTKSVANMVYFGEQDISPMIRFLSNVYEKIDFLHPPLTKMETRYFYRIPTYGVGKLENQFLRPLSHGVWWCFAAVSVLCAIVLMMSARLERRPSSSQYAVFSVLASVCQQYFCDVDGSGIRRESSARKLTVLVTGMSCVLIYNYYTSSVVSWLLNGPPPSITSLQELLESPLELIYEDQGYARSWVQTPTYYFNKRNAEIEDRIRQKRVFDKKKDAPLLMSLNKGIRMAKEGGYAFHVEVHSAFDLISKSFSQEELCELGSLESMPMTDLYPCVQKNSPYKEFLSWSLLRLKERGIVSRVQRRTSPVEATCEGSSPRALALGGAAPAFILLAGGYLLALIIMIAERIFQNTRREPIGTEKSLNLEKIFRDLFNKGINVN